MWIQYRATILDGMARWVTPEPNNDGQQQQQQQQEQGGQQQRPRRVLQTDADGRPIVVPRRVRGQLRELDLARMEKTENPLPVRIARQLMMEERKRLHDDSFVLGYDMGDAIYSPRRLFDPAEQKAVQERAAKATRLAPVPAAEDGQEGEPPAAPQIEIDDDAPYARSVPGVYHLRVRRDCDPDDPDAEKVPYQWYILSLREVAVRDLDVLDGRPVIARNGGETQALSQVVNTLLRSAFAFAGFPTVSAYSFIKDPRGVLKNLLQSREMKGLLNRNGDVFPSIGVLQLLKFCMTGGEQDGRQQQPQQQQPYVQRDTKIGFLDKPNVRVLSEEGGRHSIAGVDVRNPRQTITDPRLREQIEEALRNKKFDVRCKLFSRCSVPLVLIASLHPYLFIFTLFCHEPRY